MGNVLYAASTGIRPRAYVDDDKSRDRAGVYALFVLIFVGAIIGLAVYQSQNRTSKQVKVSFPKYDDVLNLYDKFYNDEIGNLGCDCNHPFENIPAVNASQNGYCRTYVTDNVTGIPYIGLCDDLDQAINDQYSRTKISAGPLLDIYDLSDEIYSAYLESCGKMIATNLGQAKTLATYFAVQNITNATKFTEECVKGVWQVLYEQAADYNSLLCDAADTYSIVAAEPATFYCDDISMMKYGIPNITTYWDDYFCTCAVKSCSYSEKQSNFDVFLVLVSYIGTLFGVVMALAAIMYGLLYSQVNDVEQKKKRRRKRAQAAHEAEQKLEAALKDQEEEESSSQVVIRDDAEDGELEDAKEGAFRSDKCFVTACKDTPLNKTMFCARHGGMAKPDDPPKDK